MMARLTISGRRSGEIREVSTTSSGPDAASWLRMAAARLRWPRLLPSDSGRGPRGEGPAAGLAERPAWRKWLPRCTRGRGKKRPATTADVTCGGLATSTIVPGGVTIRKRRPMSSLSSVAAAKPLAAIRVPGRHSEWAHSGRDLPRSLPGARPPRAASPVVLVARSLATFFSGRAGARRLLRREPRATDARTAPSQRNPA